MLLFDTFLIPFYTFFRPLHHVERFSSPVSGHWRNIKYTFPATGGYLAKAKNDTHVLANVIMFFVFFWYPVYYPKMKLFRCGHHVFHRKLNKFSFTRAEVPGYFTFEKAGSKLTHPFRMKTDSDSRTKRKPIPNFMRVQNQYCTLIGTENSPSRPK